MKRIAILSATGALVASSAFGAWSAHAAGSDDGHRAVTQVSSRHGEPEPGDDHGHHGAGHTRHGEAEPGDDHGDHGGHHGGDDD